MFSEYTFLEKGLWNSVTEYRAECMGVAMILVFLYHSPSELLGYLSQGVFGSFISYGYLGGRFVFVYIGIFFRLWVLLASNFI